MRYYITHPPDPRPALIVDVVSAADLDLQRFLSDLWSHQTSHGLLIDLGKCIVVRDSFTSLDQSSLTVEGEIKTADLMGRLTSLAELQIRVGQWLDKMTRDWRAALPPDQETAILMTDVVPALIDANIWTSNV